MKIKQIISMNLFIVLLLVSIVSADNLSDTSGIISDAKNELENKTEELKKGIENISQKINQIEDNIEGLNPRLPGQLGYGFKRFFEKTRLFFTFSERKRTKYRIDLANRRVAELNKAYKEDIDEEKIKELSKDYNKTLEEIDQGVERMRDKGEETSEIEERLAGVTYNHIILLNNNLKNVTDERKERLRKTALSSLESYSKVRGTIAERGGIDDSEIKSIRERLESRIRKKINKSSGLCAQVITPAIDPETGECVEFPTPCDVPEEWIKVHVCPKIYVSQINSEMEEAKKIGRNLSNMPA